MNVGTRFMVLWYRALLGRKCARRSGTSSTPYSARTETPANILQYPAVYSALALQRGAPGAWYQTVDDEARGIADALVRLSP